MTTKRPDKRGTKNDLWLARGDGESTEAYLLRCIEKMEDDLAAAIDANPLTKVALAANAKTSRPTIDRYPSVTERLGTAQDQFPTTASVANLKAEHNREIGEWKTKCENLARQIDVLATTLEAYEAAGVKPLFKTAASAVERVRDIGTAPSARRTKK